MKKKMPAAAWILAALVLGIIAGYMVFVSYPDKETAAQIAGYVSILSDAFLRLIKMLIGPLVFSTLVVGIAHMGDAASVGRVFAKALGLPSDKADTYADSMKTSMATLQPIPRAGMTDDIARAAVFLASDDSTFINGHDLVVDGGVVGGRLWGPHQEGVKAMRQAFGVEVA